MAKTIKEIIEKKNVEKISMITAYDFFSAKFAQEAGIDLILVGDSLGMVILGYENTLFVALEDIIYHTRAVKRGADKTLIVADMPFMSFHISIEESIRNAGLLIQKGKAQAVKIEGGKSRRLQMIKAIIDSEIPVMGHLGLTPQSVYKFSGYRVQGKDEKSRNKLIEQACELDEIGVFALVLEAVPEGLGEEITKAVSVPTIGIGAGRSCDGQVLVYHDLLGYTEQVPRFVKKYTDLHSNVVKAISQYIQEIKKNQFPAKEHCYYPKI